MIILQDSFTDIEGTQLENHTPEIGSWICLGEYATITSNQMTNNYYLKSFYKANMTNDTDMSFQMKVNAIGFETIIFLARMTVSPFNAYGLQLTSANAKFVRYDNGILSTLKTFYIPGMIQSIIKFDVTGNTLSAYKNGILVDSINDSVYSSGVAGFYFPSWGGSLAQFDDALIEIPLVAKTDHLAMTGLH